MTSKLFNRNVEELSIEELEAAIEILSKSMEYHRTMENRYLWEICLRQFIVYTGERSNREKQNAAR